MKVLAVFLLCAFAAVQGRSAGIQKSTLAVRGENPWLVHLRRAVSTSGFLESSAGSLIAPNWVLTSAEAVKDSRFIWLRYDSLNVVHPGLVTETSATRIDPSAVLALVSVNRNVESTAYISPVSLVNPVVPASASFCAWGEKEENVPGEELSCFEVSLVSEEDGSITASSDDGAASQFDLGAPLVSEGVQVAVLVSSVDDTKAGTFVPVAGFLDWIESEINPDESDVDSVRVQFVN